MGKTLTLRISPGQWVKLIVSTHDELLLVTLLLTDTSLEAINLLLYLFRIGTSCYYVETKLKIML